MDRIAIRRGSSRPVADELNENELGYWTAGQSLFIGTASGPVLLGSAKAAEGRFPYLRVTGVYQPSQLPINSIFEGSDGRL